MQSGNAPEFARAERDAQKPLLQALDATNHPEVGDLARTSLNMGANGKAIGPSSCRLRRPMTCRDGIGNPV
jgi:hypothetical protein